MAEMCGFVTFKRQGNNPEEHCDAECLAGSTRCDQHRFDEE